MPITTTDKGLVTVFGGSGFVGRHLVRALLKRGWRVRAAVRRPDLAGHLQPLGNVGWVQPIQANVRYRWSVDRAVEGANAVVNLVAVGFDRGRQTLDAVNVFGARAIAEATRAAGISRLVHVSAIGADPDSPSGYGRSKAAAEAAVFETTENAVVIRPSLQFGPEDQFINRFAAMSRFMLAIPAFGGGTTKLQPVFVGDVARALADAVEGKVPAGRIYELGGPEIKTLREIIQLVVRDVDRRRLIVTMPWWAAKLAGYVMGHLPGRLVTSDQVRQLMVDNVVSEQAKTEGRTFAAFGIAPVGIETILPTYLWRYRPRGQFERRAA
jgi:NADH dehydrogenase